MMAQSINAREEDRLLAIEITKAHRFSTCLHLGPCDRHTHYFDAPWPDGYRQALADADELNKLSKFGRRTVIYAINKLGSFDVSPKLAALAGWEG
jgi:hypothetical protein